MRVLKSFLLIFLLIGFIAACSEDDEPNNPVTPQDPESVGTYSGTNSVDSTTTIVISNVDGEAKITSYSVNYRVQNNSTTYTGTYSESSTSGLATVVGSTFTFSVGSNPENNFTGVIVGNTITGSFAFPANPLSPMVVGTYTVTKQ